MRFQDRRSRRILIRELTDYRYGLRDLQPKEGSVLSFLDIGANAGLISLYAKMQFPKMKVCAVEPDPDTFKCLYSNTHGMGIEKIRAGLGASGTKINRAAGHKTSVARRYQLADEGVDAHTLRELLAHFNIDANTTWLKCDCEGGEWTMRGDKESEDLLKQMPCLSFELHAIDRRASVGKLKAWLDTILDGTHSIVACAMARRLGNVVYTRNDVLDEQ